MSQALPPPNWTDNVTGLITISLVLFGGGLVYFSAQLIVAASEGSLWAAMTAGGFAVCLLGFLSAIGVTLLASSDRHADCSSAGTTVRVNPAIAWSYGVALLGGAIGASCFLLFVSRGLAELPFATPGEGRVTRYLVSSLLVLSVGGLIALLRTREPGYLRIGVDGVEHADMLRTRRARWEDIVEVKDKADKRARNPLVFVVKDSKPVVVANAERFGSSGPALYWMARHYWQHPGDRGELSDGRALERLRAEEFEPS